MSTSRDNDDGDGEFREFVLADAVEASKDLLKEVKERFPNKFNLFCKLLSDFTKRRIDVESLGVKVKKLFKGYDDLIHKYNAFLPNGYEINLNDSDEETVDSDEETFDSDEETVDNRDDSDNDDGGDSDNDDGGGVKKLESVIDFVNKVKIRFQNEERVYEEFLEIFKRNREERFSLHELKSEVAKLFDKHKDLFEEFDRYISDKEQKHVIRSIHDFNFSNSKQISPSYWLLPDNCVTPLASHISEVGTQVLNNKLFCVNTGSEGSSFYQRRRTQEEEILFEWEDDRFELDMLLERVNSAATRVEKLMIKIDDQNQDNEEISKIEIEGHLNEMNLRCIERLYGVHGLDVIETLHETPITALPVILKSLQQKQTELVKFRSDFNKVLAHVFAKNHHKLQ